MKKTVALAIIGVAAVTTAFGQGHVIVSNYLVPPYNQVIWDAAIPTVGGQAVTDTSVQLTYWYIAGTGAPDTAGNSLTVNPALTFDPGAGAGGGGYYSGIFLAPAVGTYTVEVRASGTTAYGPVTGSSTPFEVTTVSTGLPAETAPFSPGLMVSIVPEPTTFALAGLGAAALLIFRRRD